LHHAHSPPIEHNDFAIRYGCRCFTVARHQGLWRIFMRRLVCLFCLGVCLALACDTAGAQVSPDTTTGPVPPAIQTAKKIFISNAGSDSGLFPEPFSGDPNRPYSEFYAALKAMSQYELVSDPSDADLVLELRLLAPYGPSYPNKQHGTSDPLPMVRMVVYDRKTHYVLWAFTESVDPAILQKTHDRNLDNAILEVAGDFQKLGGTKAAPAQ
jgi:hypothetical protein